MRMPFNGADPIERRMRAETASYRIADEAIEQTIEHLERRGACPCCVATAMIENGIALAEGVMGTDAAIAILEKMLTKMRGTPVPAPDRVVVH